MDPHHRAAAALPATVPAAADVCAACPNSMPPCAGIADRGLCPAIQALGALMGDDDAATQRDGKPRGDLDAAVAAARKLRGI